ncbi:PAS domain-containing protein [Pseudogemmobacter sonorensis]|uniref:PAS domain-containing protein n=1 Tax=Pseudogemmobacter sonorensis TaxID=2989681 RepID=UPI00367A6D50
MVFSFLGGGARPTPRDTAPQILRAYWEALRREDGGFPTRAMLDPRGLAPILSHVFIAERIGEGILRLGIAGSGLADLGGCDMRGLPLTMLFLPGARARITPMIEAVARGRSLARIDLLAERALGQPELSARMLLLPLAPEDHGSHPVLGCLAGDGKAERKPRRFTVTHARSEPLEGPLESPLRPGPLRHDSLHIESPPIEGFAEHALPRLRPSGTATAARAPHLRLVHTRRTPAPQDPR